MSLRVLQHHLGCSHICLATEHPSGREMPRFGSSELFWFLNSKDTEWKAGSAAVDVAEQDQPASEADMGPPGQQAG